MHVHILLKKGVLMITISNKKASIAGVQSIISIIETKMIFKLKNKICTITGNYLRVVMYTPEEIWIDGDIKQVIFDEK